MDSFEISSENYDPSTLASARVQHQEKQVNPEQPQQRKQSPTPEPKPAAANGAEKPRTQPAVSTTERWKMFAGILFIIAAVYMLIVSISFFANGAADQSIVQNTPYSDVSVAANDIKNTGGPFGAVLSDILMSRWLGIGSFILIFYIGALGVSLVKIKHFSFWNLTYKCLLTAIVLSVLTGFLTYKLTSYNHWGGNHGRAVNEMLITHTGIWGAIGVNILLVSAVVLVFLKEIQHAWDVYITRVRRHKEKLARERAEAEARRKTAENNLSDSEIEKVNKPEAPLAENISEPVPAKPVHTAENIYHPEPDPTPVVSPRVSEPVSPQLDEIPDEDPQAWKKPSFPEREPQPTAPLTIPSQSVHSKTDDVPVIEHTPEPAVMETETTLAEIPVVEEPEEENADNVTMTVNTPEEEKAANHIQTDFYDPTAELSSFRSPSIDLLENRETRTDHVDLAEQEENKEKLTKTLSTYGVKISHIEATVGPTITRYEVIPAQGERIRSIKSLGDDLALSLSALGIRIIAPIPGKGTIGIEVPNKDPQIVGMKSILASEKFQNTEFELPIAMGRTITNEIYIADLAKLPHLLVAGATGMGKSVGLNAIIASLLYKKHPAELKFVLIDPKRVELSLYRKLERHYLAALPGEDAIITDTSKVVAVLNSLCIEMGNRLSLLEDAGVRNIKEYNAKFIARRLNPNKHKFMPYIVLIIDEFADIILTQGKEVENPVSRLAAVARAAGIHLILATQRPAVNVITGGIKTNIPGRIAFRTIQSVDSRTILDRTGAEQLVGKGDMIFSKDGVLERVQCAFIDTDEVKAICDSIADQIGYDRPYDLPEYVPAGAEGATGKSGNLTDRDPLFVESGRLVIETNMGSASNLQRKFNIGYPRAGKIMDQLEIAGVVGPPQGGKPRQVLMDMMAFEEYLRNSGSNQ